MEESDFKNLTVGDTIQNNGSGEAFQIIGDLGDRYIAIRTLQVTNAQEWKKIPRRVK